MQQPAFLRHSADLPVAADPDRARLGLDRWREAARASQQPDLIAFAESVASDPHGRALLACILGNSSYLGQILLLNLPFARTIFARGLDATFSDLLTGLNRTLFREQARDRLMADLRQAKRRAALLVAIADITGAWSLRQVTASLTLMAETALGLGVRFLLRRAAASGQITLADDDDPERDSGLIVLGMGKLGSRELNYSSDIDLIFLFDPDCQPGRHVHDLQDAFVKLGRELVAILSQITRDGYVFRTDTRLRPDPGLTRIALSVGAAESYYGSIGQNWERAAMIKARPVAGDRAAGQRFLDHIKPFIWRKHLDFAAIQDIHSIKRQIFAHRGGAQIAARGHDIKTGRGGIREIEFIAQTLQLIWGGREPALRCRGTVEALERLKAHGLIEAQAADELAESYGFLRRLEHRLQMIGDQQTQKLPAAEDGFNHLAAFMGYAAPGDFEAALIHHLRQVEHNYAALFEEAPDLGEGGNLVFTGVDNDPDTVETLTRMGFADAASICNVVRGWHHGRTRATRSQRARELLTELTPTLLGALARTANPDAAFANFAQFLSGLPAGVQLFSLFLANPELLELVAEIMGTAPSLGEQLNRNPILLDGVLTRDFFALLPDADELADDLSARLGEAADLQDVLDIVRRFANDRKFQVGIQMLRRMADVQSAAAVLSDIAEVVVRAVHARVTQEFAAAHGGFGDAGHGLAIIALGKLGGREMTSRSDVDLVFLYDFGTAEHSDGPKPLPPLVYAARLSQRILTAITALTGEGRLYEVDLRLRPSGNRGPIAATLDGFADYQAKKAWTWEHMALTRARPIAGPEGLCTRAATTIRELLTAPRDADVLCRDIADMHRRVATEKRPRSVWDVKQWRGGLVDLEFLAQYLQLRHAAAHPEVLDTNTIAALAKLRDAGVLDPDDAEVLTRAARLWQGLQAMLRLTVGDPPADEAVPDGVATALIQLAELPDLKTLRAAMEETAAAVAERLDARLLAPAAALGTDAAASA